MFLMVYRKRRHRQFPYYSIVLVPLLQPLKFFVPLLPVVEFDRPKFLCAVDQVEYAHARQTVIEGFRPFSLAHYHCPSRFWRHLFLR